MAHRKQATTNRSTGDWAEPAAVRFPDQASRDGFLRSVVENGADAWEAEPIEDDARGAWVRWRAGHFLKLNDMAYARHGRINITVVRRKVTSAPGMPVARRHGRMLQL